MMRHKTSPFETFCTMPRLRKSTVPSSRSVGSALCDVLNIYSIWASSWSTGGIPRAHSNSTLNFLFAQKSSIEPLQSPKTMLFSFKNAIISSEEILLLSASGVTVMNAAILSALTFRLMLALLCVCRPFVPALFLSIMYSLLP